VKGLRRLPVLCDDYLNQDHCALVYTMPTQAHVRAVGAATAPNFAAVDATALDDVGRPRLAKLKSDLLRCEATLPRDALIDSWDSTAWQEVQPVLQPPCRRTQDGASFSGTNACHWKQTRAIELSDTTSLGIIVTVNMCRVFDLAMVPALV